MTKSKNSKTRVAAKKTPPPTAKAKAKPKPMTRSLRMTTDPMEVDPEQPQEQPPAKAAVNPGSKTPGPPPPYGAPMLIAPPDPPPDAPRSHIIAAGETGPMVVTGHKTASDLDDELSGEPAETGALNMPLNDSTDDIVALENKPTATVPDNLKIDDEFMTVLDASNPNNLKVARAAHGTVIQAHDVGAVVGIYGTPLETDEAPAE